MMPGLSDDHPSLRFYDSDYPGTETSPIAANLDGTVAAQGLAHDIGRFRQIAKLAQGRVLEVGCGTGRVLIPMARDGHDVTGIDISPVMLDRLRTHLLKEEKPVQDRVTLKIADVCTYEEADADYATIIIPFNTLNCIPDFEDQRTALKRVACLLSQGGHLVVDVVNPMALPLAGSSGPQPFFTRIDAETRRTYTRFAAMGPMEPDQTQRLYGWYDEIDEDARVIRMPYEMRWRLIFRYELALMVEEAGLAVTAVEGDHQGASFGKGSPKIFLIASRP